MTGWAVTVDGVDQSAIVDRTSWEVSGTAHLGEATDGGFDLADDAGSITLPGRKVVIWSAGGTRIGRGRIGVKDLARGLLPVGSAKEYAVTLTDSNLDLRGLRVNGWSRPAETDYARVQALATAFLKGSPRASTNLDTTTYVPNTNTVSLPAKRYDATDPFGVLKEIAGTSGKEFFVTLDEQLFYDLGSSTAYASTLSITDSSPDELTSFAPDEPNTGAQQNPQELYSGMELVYGQNLSVTEQRSAVAAAYDFWEEVVNDNAATSSTAATRLSRLLDAQDVEDLTYKVEIVIPEAKVGSIKYGQTISFRSAAAGVLTPTVLRIARLAWREEAPQTYRAIMELGKPLKLAPRVSSGSPLPSSDANAVITIANGGLTAGVSVAPTLAQGFIANDQPVFSGWQVISPARAGSWHAHNLTWPYTPCGVGLGAYIGWQDQYVELVYVLPADSSYVVGSFAVTYDHNGPTPDSGDTTPMYYKGPYVMSGPIAGATGLASDIVPGGIALGTLSGSSGSDQLIVPSGAALPWGTTVRYLIAPGFRASPDFICVGTSGFKIGWANFTAAPITPYSITPGAYGWLTAGISGAQDGTNQTFTLVGGYSTIGTVWRNGITLPSNAWSATDGSTIVFQGWAPLATDLITVSRYVPK